MSVREIISSYDQPIILGLTPYSRTRVTISDAAVTPDWPPYIDSVRLSRYDEYTKLIENAAQDVFRSLQLSVEQKSKIAIAVAIPELLCNVWADAVWSDPPTLEFTSDEIKNRWDVVDRATNWSESLAWESVFGSAGWGTSVLYLRRDESRVAEFGTSVVIDEIDPAIYFPVLKPGSSREIDRVVLAWEEDRAAPDGTPEIWQIREFHYLDAGQYHIATQERRSSSGLSVHAFRTVKEEAPEGVDFLPFIDMHAKRWRGRYWGVSEISRIMSLLDELDNTVSNIAEILEYHGKPMLQVPASVIYGGTLTKGADKTLGIRRADEADIARYITFDGMIDSQLAHLDKTLELIMLTSEVPRTYFGLGTESAPPSGVSLKLQLQNYLKKAGRWQRNETARLNTLVPMALRLDGALGDSVAKAVVPEVRHGSPLPADDEQEVRIITAANAAGIMSKKSAVTVLKRLGYVDDVDDELDEIQSEKEDSIAALPAAFSGNFGGGGQPANSSTDPNAGEQPPA